jgi:uncharacterized membrane protein YkoI
MKRLLIAVLLAAPLAVSANGAFKDCSTKASKTTKKAELMTMAKVKADEAKKAALAAVPGATTVTKGGIETEEGCLVYSYHVKDPGGKGATEVFVDAGTGKVLKTDKESALRTAVEKPVDKVKEAAGAVKEKTTGKPSTSQSPPK